VVAYTAYEGAPVEVSGVPDTRKSAAEEERYKRETFIDDKTHDKLSWQWATMRSLFARGPRGTIICVVVVERKSGEPIAVTAQQAAPDVCAIELQLAAEVWATAWEDS
jgi:hypothetical protein